MKKQLLLFSFAILLITTSCSVYEDITFHDNGGVSYKLTIDASEMMAMMGDMSDNEMIDPGETISLEQQLRDSIGDITPEIEQDLRNISPYYVSYFEDSENGKMEITFFGDFDSAEAYNRANISLYNLQREGDDDEMALILTRNRVSWDGKTMTKHVPAAPEKKKEDETEEREDLDKSVSGLLEMFSSGKMTIRYHFPHEVKSADNNDALLSIDKKTVVLNYPGAVFVNPGNETDIKIETQK